VTRGFSFHHDALDAVGFNAHFPHDGYSTTI
jgi:hypothetical protein